MRFATDVDVTTLRGRRADRRWNRMAVGDVLERLTWSRPDHVAITGWHGAYGDETFRSLTYREADEAANRVAHALLAEGLEPGARVLLYCDNSVEALVAMIGIAKAGLVAVPVNPMLAADVLAWAVEHVDVSFAVVDAEFAEWAAWTVPRFVTIPIGGVAPGTSFHDWIRDHPSTEVEVDVHADDVWSLVFTSGTTAMPKAAMFTHTYSYVTASSYALSLTRGLRYEDELALATFLPIVYHCGHNSAVLPAFFAGGRVILGRRRPGHDTAAALADAITAERVTALWAGSPQWLQDLVDEAEARPGEVDPSCLTVAMFSWGAMRSDLFSRLRAVCGGDLALLEVFGQTESMSCYRFWVDRESDKEEGVNHVGVPNPMLAAGIVDEAGDSLRGRPGVAGEAVYRSPALTAGYYRDAAATEEAFRGGWFHSGDSCAYEDDGSQLMVDRFKDIVKSGGENVSSLRVESVIAGHPGVDRVAVIGLPDDTWGEAVTAVVLPAAGVWPDENELIAFARRGLAGHECPKRVHFVDDLPQTVGGKILKYQLRQRFAS